MNVMHTPYCSYLPQSTTPWPLYCSPRSIQAHLTSTVILTNQLWPCPCIHRSASCFGRVLHVFSMDLIRIFKESHTNEFGVIRTRILWSWLTFMYEVDSLKDVGVVSQWKWVCRNSLAQEIYYSHSVETWIRVDGGCLTKYTRSGLFFCHFDSGKKHMVA